jgi:adenylate cyclase
MDWSDDTDASLQQAYAAARTAITIDPHNEMGHWGLAETLVTDGDFERGLRAYDKAMEINPNNPDLMVTRGTNESIYGRFDVGIDRIRQAIDRNRHHPEWYFWHLGIACFTADRLAEAIEAFECMNEQNKDTLGYLVASLAHEGRLAEARTRLKQLVQLDSGFSVEAAVDAHGYMLDDARKRLRDGLQLALDGEKPRLKSVR